MTKKSKTDEEHSPSDPLESLTLFDPAAMEDKDLPEAPISDRPVSPLGPPAPIVTPAGSSIEMLLHQANRRIEQLQAEVEIERRTIRDLERQNYQLQATGTQAEKALKDLEQERQTRLELERKLAAMEIEVKLVHSQLASLETEREARIELERRIGTLEYQADKMTSAIDELAEERSARIELEREKASLEIEVQHARKLEQMLSEERKGRANAQMRASTAEARLAQIEGKMAASGEEGRKGIFGRGRGR